MGFSPRVIDEMSLWELFACVDAYKKANGGEEEVEAPSWEEHLKMVRTAAG
jgi:hypothetical protein